MEALKVPGSSPGQIITFCWIVVGERLMIVSQNHVYRFAALRCTTHFSVANSKLWVQARIWIKHLGFKLF